MQFLNLLFIFSLSLSHVIGLPVGANDPAPPPRYHRWADAASGQPKLLAVSGSTSLVHEGSAVASSGAGAASPVKAEHVNAKALTWTGGSEALAASNVGKVNFHKSSSNNPNPQQQQQFIKKLVCDENKPTVEEKPTTQKKPDEVTPTIPTAKPEILVITTAAPGKETRPTRNEKTA